MKPQGTCAKCGREFRDGEPWVMVLLGAHSGFPVHVGPCPRSRLRQVYRLWRKAYA